MITSIDVKIYKLIDLFFKNKKMKNINLAF